MPGIDPLTIGSLMVLASGGAGGLKCDMPKPTEINVVPKSLDVRYDYSQSLSQIQRQNTDTISPYGFGEFSVGHGYALSGVKVSKKAILGIMKYPTQGAVCAWYDTIDIVLEIDPTIVIAKEVRADSCKYRAVLEHELKHIKVTRLMANKYAKIIGQKLYEELSLRGFKSQIVAAPYLEGLKTRMQETVFQIVDHEVRKMELELIDLQRDVDSREEYERVSAKCK